MPANIVKGIAITTKSMAMMLCFLYFFLIVEFSFFSVFLGKKFISAIKSLYRELNMQFKFENPVNRDTKYDIAKMSLKDACIVTNPVAVNENDIVKILDKLM